MYFLVSMLSLNKREKENGGRVLQFGQSPDSTPANASLFFPPISPIVNSEINFILVKYT